MSRNRFKRLVATLCFLLLLATLLLLSACGGSSSPGSPKATPTSGGYGYIQHPNQPVAFTTAPPT